MAACWPAGMTACQHCEGRLTLIFLVSPASTAADDEFDCHPLERRPLRRADETVLPRCPGCIVSAGMSAGLNRAGGRRLGISATAVTAPRGGHKGTRRGERSKTLRRLGLFCRLIRFGPQPTEGAKLICSESAGMPASSEPCSLVDERDKPPACNAIPPAWLPHTMLDASNSPKQIELTSPPPWRLAVTFPAAVRGAR
jgi:hypothetical protein